jgi:predicted ATPase/serine/threonine protein kinase
MLDVAQTQMSEPDDLIGHILDSKYRLDDVLGSGGMGVVYRATHLQLDRPIAIKLVRRDVAFDRSIAGRFESEARTVARLHHRHIVTVHDYGVAADVGAYLVMELLDGRSLRDEIRRRGRLSIDQVILIARQACDALQAAHNAGIVHRDVKPENIFLEGAHDPPVVKVLDFGIARLESRPLESGSVTQPGSILGTPRYMSPEQFEAGPIDARSDIYSLGCVLYEALAGRPPFTSDSPAALRVKHAGETPSSLRRFVPQIQFEVDDVVLRALAKHPNQRFQSAGELAAAFERAVAASDAPNENSTALLESELSPATAIHFPPFRLLLDVDVLFDGEAVVAIERQPLRVLRYLIDNRDRVVTKEELLDRLWPDVFTTESVLKRAISMVRRALSDDPKESRFIRTYHGQGYQFIAEVSRAHSPERESTVPPREAGVTAFDESAPSTPLARAGETRPGLISNLPHVLTSFVGRETEQKSIQDNLSHSRLVTLVGPGGIGKTRLAIEAARGTLADYPDGVWLVELAALADPLLVPEAVAKALGVREQPSRLLVDTLASWLEHKRLLVVLDNCEHLVDSCAGLVERLLASCSELRILATSREALSVPGEARWQVPSLTTGESTRLFVERARAFRSSFDAEAGSALDELCGQLEGLPLAIELAAASARALTVRQILERMQDRFRLLAGGPRTAARRQQTVRATVEWSHDLLTDEERILFRRLAVFSGGWTLSAAESVCGDTYGSAMKDESKDPNLHPSEVLHHLERLIDKSIVHVTQDDDRLRYSMLETVREFAREKLRISGEENEFRDRHLEWAIDFAEAPELDPTTPRRATWVDRVNLDVENVRSALRWSAGRSSEGQLRLCVAMAPYWDKRTYWKEGREWLTRAVTATDGAVSTIRAEAFGWLGVVERQLSLFDEAKVHLEAGIELFRALGDLAGVGRELHALGDLLAQTGDLDSAADAQEECLAISRALGDDRAVANALSGVGLVAFYRADLSRSRAVYEECVDIYRRFGDLENVGTMLFNLSDIAHELGNVELSRTYLHESLEIAEKQNMGILAASSALSLANLAAEGGDFERASPLFAKAIRAIHKMGNRWLMAHCVESIAEFNTIRGAHERALQLYAASRAIREAIHTPLSPTVQAKLDERSELSRIAVGDVLADRAMREGQAMTDDEIVRCALDGRVS